MFHRGEDVFPMVVSEVSAILKYKGLCELGVCDPRCIPKEGYTIWVNILLVSHFFNVWYCVCGI